MEQKDIKLEEKTVYMKDTGKHYVTMMVPEGWGINITEDRDRYGGNGHPYTFRIRFTSPDRTVAINYFSPRNYSADRLQSYSNGQIDDYGVMLKSFNTVEEYLSSWAKSDLKEYDGVQFIRSIEGPNMDQREEKRRQQMLERYKDSGKQLQDYYYRWLCQVYGYRYKDTDRIRAYAGFIEGEDIISWATVPNASMFAYDPFMKNMMTSVYPNCRYDQKSGNYIYTSINEIEWAARQLLTMDCMKKDFDLVYDQVFSKIFNKGVLIHDDVWNDFAAVAKENRERNRRIREEKKEAARIQREAAEQRRESSRQLYESIRKTQQETHDILNSAYENQQKSQAKVREMWGDVNQGNTRFVDRHGNEHVIHTYDNYAYKSGDTYVTSDSPLDHSYDWEELEKKKY